MSEFRLGLTVWAVHISSPYAIQTKRPLWVCLLSFTEGSNDGREGANGDHPSKCRLDLPS